MKTDLPPIPNRDSREQSRLGSREHKVKNEIEANRVDAPIYAFQNGFSYSASTSERLTPMSLRM